MIRRRVSKAVGLFDVSSKSAGQRAGQMEQECEQ
jgi:hypothetical protein